MEPVRASAKFALSHFEVPMKKISQRFGYAKKLMKSAEKSIKTTPRTAELSLFNRDAVYLSTKAQNRVGYEPKFDLDTALKITVQWLRHVGLAD
jgi:nucleoside-diphosphate-sugar epimerase